MAWEKRGRKGKLFYYRSVRAGGRVRKVYLGSGRAAQKAAQEDARAKAKRAADAAALSDWQLSLLALDGLMTEIKYGVDLLTQATMLSAGCHQHKGEWRCGMAMIFHKDNGEEVTRGGKKKPVRQQEASTTEKAKETPPEQPAKRPLSQLETIIHLARQGRKEILPKLRQVFDKCPELWRHFGDLAGHAQEAWLQRIAGQDLYFAEAMRRHLDSMRSELAGRHPTPLEKLLVDRILAIHVQILYLEAHEAQQAAGQNSKFDQYRAKRQDQAHHQFLAAAKTLAVVRHLSARTIQVELVQAAPFGGSGGPILGGMNGINGDQPGMRGGTSNGSAGRRTNFNGRNRIAPILSKGEKASASV